MKQLLVALVMLTAYVGATCPASAQPVGTLEIWRLDCGTIDVDLAEFSDTGFYRGEKRTLANSCYLVRNNGRLLLWDTGLDRSLAGKPKDAEGNALKETVLTQLKRIDIEAAAIDFVAISHYHYDHIGQAADFPAATLLMGKRDLEVVRSHEFMRAQLGPWTLGSGKVEEVTGDKDVFSDGRVTMLSMPGHTFGHYALLVRLDSGPIILSGDQYHFAEQVTNQGVPPFNADRAATLASHDRIDRLARQIGARLIIQHEPLDIPKLPTLPQAAR